MVLGHSAEGQVNVCFGTVFCYKTAILHSPVGIGHPAAMGNAS